MIKALIRRTVRALAVRVMARPALAASAKRLIALAPALDRRLRRIVGGPAAPAAAQPQLQPQSQPASPVPPEVARVLVDLRHALAEREPGRKST